MGKTATLSLECLGRASYWLFLTLTEKITLESSALEALPARREGFINKEVDELEDELRPEYDFAKMVGGVKGKYVERYRKGTNLVLLAPDVAQAFPTDASVNDALRLVIQIAQRQHPKNSVGAE